MAITFVNAGAAGVNSGSGNATLVAPASPQTDDIWIASCHSHDNVAHSFTDWTQITQFNGGGTDTRLSVWYFRYAGSTPNLVVTHTSGDVLIGGIAAYRGCKTSGSPVNTTGATNTGTNDTPIHKSITPSVDGCCILLCGGDADDDDVSLPGSYLPALDGGTENDYKTLTGSDTCVWQLYLVQGSATATSDQSWDVGTSANWAAIQIALEPGVAVGQPTVKRGGGAKYMHSGGPIGEYSKAVKVW